MKKLIFIFTALPLFAFAENYSCDELLNDMNNSCNGSGACIDTFHKYFEIISDTCTYNETERFTYYKLLKPLTLKGTLKYVIDYGASACSPDVIYTIFTPDDEDFNFLTGSEYNGALVKKSFKDIENMLPKWFKETMLAGSVSFNVELTLENIKDEFYALYEHRNVYKGLGQNISACNFGDEREIFPKSIKVLGKKSEEKAGLSSYIYVDISMIYYTLNTEDDYVNIRETPNGKILFKIYKSDIDKIVIVDLDQARSNISDKKSINDKWVQVVYFPDKEDEYNSIAGYIHKSQIKQIEDIYKFLNNGK